MPYAAPPLLFSYFRHFIILRCYFDKIYTFMHSGAARTARQKMLFVAVFCRFVTLRCRRRHDASLRVFYVFFAIADVDITLIIRYVTPHFLFLFFAIITVLFFFFRF